MKARRNDEPTKAGRKLRVKHKPDTLTPEEAERRVLEYKSRTPEQIAAGRAELERVTEEMREHVARGGSLDEPDRVVLDEGVEELAARVLLQAEDARRMRLALPCYRAMYPNGVEPDGLDDKAYREEDGAGLAACEAVSWHLEHGKIGDADHRLPCMRGLRGENCPRARVLQRRDDARLKLASAQVPDADASLVLKIITGQLRPSGLTDWPSSGPIAGQYLDRLDSVRVVREVARRSACSLEDLENAGERMSGGRARTLVTLRGDELIIALGGNKGRGKSTAAQLVLALFGGLYTLEYDYGRPRVLKEKKHGIPIYEGLDLQECIRATPWLVIDQVGRAALGGESRFLIANIEEVVDKRRAKGRKTILVGNFTYEQLLARYGDRQPDGSHENLILDRILGHGVLIEFGGESLREHLRGEG